ncbi:MAG: hypothetical protein H7A45_21100 [Verrucomicrobiales bacterium]|nr:hypothetical protein [Verrucomicrobiales bacterium]
MRNQERRRALLACCGWLLGLSLAGVGGLMAQPIARGGSPLYLLAVRESVAGLQSRANPAAPAAAGNGAGAVPLNTNQLARARTAPVAALPEALSKYYYYCTNCAAYHLRSSPLTNAVSPLPVQAPLAAPTNAPASAAAPPRVASPAEPGRGDAGSGGG